MAASGYRNGAAVRSSGGSSRRIGRITVARDTRWLSDWDFAVTTSDFGAVARDLAALIAPVYPLSQQWEPLGHFPVYQLLLPGPTKLESVYQQVLDAGPGSVEVLEG